MRLYTIPAQVKMTLMRLDCLGFDYACQAAQAILQHADWDTRWDFSDASAQDLATLEDWKNETLAILN